jgi:hypothetical protein
MLLPMVICRLEIDLSSSSIVAGSPGSGRQDRWRWPDRGAGTAPGYAAEPDGLVWEGCAQTVAALYAPMSGKAFGAAFNGRLALPIRQT